MIFNKKLIECCFNITDGEHSSVQDDKNGSFFLLSNKNIIDGQIKITPDDRRISLETYDKIHKRTKLAEGDILISTVGTLGKTAIIKGEINYDFQRSVGIIKCNPSILNPQYLYYFLNNSSIQKMLVNNSKGAVQKCIFINDLKELQINCPELTEQDTISKVLSCIDDKIALNNKINSELEQIAKILYDYWFIQFEFPDGNGGAYKSSNGPMTYNEVLKREIPVGWEVKNVGEIFETILGGTPSRNNPNYWENGNINWLNSGEIANFPIIHSEELITKQGIESSATSLLPSGSIMISITGNIRVSILAIDACANQSVVGVKENDEFLKSYMYFYFKNYIPSFEVLMTGAVQKHINKDVIDKTPFLIPPKNILTLYQQIVNPLIDEIITRTLENKKLEKLRDFLLPMLMNGQIKVG